MSTEPQNSGEQNKSNGFMYRVRLVWDSAFEMVNATRLGNHLWGEVPSAVKLSPVIFVLFLIVISVLFSKGCDKNSQISTLKSDKDYFQRQLTTAFQTNSSLIQSYQLQFQTLSGSVQEKENRISALIQERDKAQLEAQEAQHSLASWMLLANSNTTNTPLTEHMDSINASLLDNAKIFNKAYEAIESRIPKFGLFINGSLIADGSQIIIPKTRNLYLQITNIGSVTAQPNLFFATSLNSTNFIFAEPWKVSTRSMMGLEGWNTLEVPSAIAIDAYMHLDEPTIYTSTNVQSGSVFIGRIDISALGTDSRRLVIVFFQQ